MGESQLLALILGISVLGLIAAWMLARWVLSRGTGTPAMQEISNAIKEGAESFMRRQNRTIIMLASLVAVGLFIGYGVLRGHHDFDPVPSAMQLAFWVTI